MKYYKLTQEQINNLINLINSRQTLKAKQILRSLEEIRDNESEEIIKGVKNGKRSSKNN